MAACVTLIRQNPTIVVRILSFEVTYSYTGITFWFFFFLALGKVSINTSEIMNIAAANIHSVLRQSHAVVSVPVTTVDSEAVFKV